MGGFSSKRYQLNNNNKKDGKTHKKRRKWKKKALSDDGQVSGAVCNNLYNLGDPQSLVISNTTRGDNGPSIQATRPAVTRTTTNRANGNTDDMSKHDNNDTNNDQHVVDKQTVGSDFVTSERKTVGAKPEPEFEVVCDLDHRLSLVVPKSPSDVKDHETKTSTCYENIQIRGEGESHNVPLDQHDEKGNNSHVKRVVSEKIKAEPEFNIVCDVTRQKSIVIPNVMTS